MKKKAKAKAAAKKQPKKAEAVSAPKVADYERRRTELEVAKVKVAPWNPRPKITPESVADLAESIKSLGVIEPLVAMMDADGCAVLLSGHRRLAAAKIAGKDVVPCDILVGIDEHTAKRMTFIANLQRKDADPLLESELVGGLVKSGMTQDEIAAETGRGREWVARRLNLSRLSKSWRKRVKDGEQITTDCLEHVAAYPEAVQEKLKKARTYSHSCALRWCDIEREFDRETQDLKNVAFDRSPCKTCPNNTGCSPDLFDWDGKPAAFGKCLDSKCYKRKVAEAIKATIADAKAAGATVKESDHHPDYSIDLRSKPDKNHDTLYVWKDYNGEQQMQWGAAPKQSKSSGEMSDEEKELRRLKIAANKARRKLAEWCLLSEGGLADAIRGEYGDYPAPWVPFAFQRAFYLGDYIFSGCRTTIHDTAICCLANDGMEVPEKWADKVAADIVDTFKRECYGVKNAALVCALFPGARDALTKEERQLIVSDADMEKLEHPEPVKWDAPAEGEAGETDETEEE